MAPRTGRGQDALESPGPSWTFPPHPAARSLLKQREGQSFPALTEVRPARDRKSRPSLLNAGDPTPRRGCPFLEPCRISADLAVPESSFHLPQCALQLSPSAGQWNLILRRLFTVPADQWKPEEHGARAEKPGQFCLLMTFQYGRFPFI
ncbi:uncharacterized protein LOC119871137 isoform X1 [Canis lupus familiaris]|uniref:uncharacterized protein LOC119871137 isoform X1 n=1 Tax=Canis lupus familiaris TaxID=9615 RepID=UPI0018F66904|nr:uncharacterized protein LOC119871137 isoform X1 [Canis lupus familiaris]XP_038327008.1 uncharacterized protein LOC119871137 isoform X1 [Canis lupus familiaris]XP_038327012.1 uncharacterized protein LOC119871137 isoform X1 [Canis lupus familiaris]